MATDKLERIYTVNLTGAYGFPRTKRAIKAVEILRAYIQRHMKARDGRVVLSNATNAFVWARSIQKPPRRIKVKAVKENGNVLVSLMDEKAAKPKFALKKRATAAERKPKKAAAGAKPAEKAGAKKVEKPVAAQTEKKPAAATAPSEPAAKPTAPTAKK
ncbi:MAG TPA: 50S ribosomal protein L31e [Candidatus Micrarchaeota archaeon]|nr:50S ribosomal protein L31e [Candidatus Micrarchaeota archaeon]